MVRLQWVEVKNKVENLEDVYIDINPIYLLTEEFYNLCIKKNRKPIKKIEDILRAKTIFETCLNYIKSIIEPNESILIDGLNRKYFTHDILEKYFETFLSILDLEQKEFADANKDVKLTSKTTPSIHFNSFQEKLIDFMNNIVIIPFINSYNKFIDYKLYKTNKLLENVTDKDIFVYFLLREVFIASKIKGSQLRQKINLAGIGTVIHETNINKSARPLQQDTRQTISEAIPSENPEEILTDIFAEEENDRVD